MKFEKSDYKDGWVGVKVGLSSIDIDMFISLLQSMKANQGHFHLTSGFKGESKIGDIEIYFDEKSNDDNFKFL